MFWQGLTIFYNGTFKVCQSTRLPPALLARITEKRNRQMGDAVNKAARLIINHCLKYGIGTVAFGWNKSQKQSIDLGFKTNQKFVQILTARFKERIEQLCNLYGLQFV